MQEMFQRKQQSARETQIILKLFMGIVFRRCRNIKRVFNHFLQKKKHATLFELNDAMSKTSQTVDKYSTFLSDPFSLILPLIKTWTVL